MGTSHPTAKLHHQAKTTPHQRSMNPKTKGGSPPTFGTTILRRLCLRRRPFSEAQSFSCSHSRSSKSRRRHATRPLLPHRQSMRRRRDRDRIARARPRPAGPHRFRARTPAQTATGTRARAHRHASACCAAAALAWVTTRADAQHQHRPRSRSRHVIARAAALGGWNPPSRHSQRDQRILFPFPTPRAPL